MMVLPLRLLVGPSPELVVEYGNIGSGSRRLTTQAIAQTQHHHQQARASASSHILADQSHEQRVMHGTVRTEVLPVMRTDPSSVTPTPGAVWPAIVRPPCRIIKSITTHHTSVVIQGRPTHEAVLESRDESTAQHSTVKRTDLRECFLQQRK